MRKMYYFQIAFFVFIFLSSSYIFTETAFAENQGEKEGLRVKEVPYNSEGRRDPFLSIIEATTKDDDDDNGKPKSPIENYDLSQFNLIAILWDNTQHLAVVGLPDNKFYTLKEGMTIGIHKGTVLKISEESVTIREIRPNHKGEMKPEDTVIKLREEEEE